MFFIRTSVFLPLAMWMTFILFMVFGLLIIYVDPGAWYYNTSYSYVTLSIHLLVLVAVIGWQVKACCK